ncbi:MAG: hypothetical protein QE271_01580 [Bacteriovoracaceae bacterium]|nr:hypothetical protein [Bacteriovoracaceae bacterium]
MLLKFLSIFWISNFILISLHAQLNSLKNCTLLPVSDNVQSSLAFRVFEQIDRELKVSSWCSYRSNTGLLSVFSNYRDKVDQVVDKPEIIKVVGEKLKVGSIIRIGLESRVGGIAARLIVYSEDGTYVYFDEQAFMADDKLESIIQQLKTWLIEYSKIIPYDGTVVGVLGDQVTVDIGPGHNRFKVGQDYMVKRMINKKIHPVFSKVVEWNTQDLAKGKITNLSDGQMIGVNRVYLSEVPLKKGDWVLIQPIPYGLDTTIGDQEKDQMKFGKIGVFTFALDGINQDIKSSTTTEKKYGGFMVGATVAGEIWLTRNYFAYLSYGRSIGDLSSDTVNNTNSKISLTSTVYKAAVGYKYLPLGFFYGPQLDIYGGIVRYSHSVDLVQSDGIGDNSFGGILLGLKVDVPIVKDIRLMLRTEMIPFADYNEQDTVYGNERSNSNIYFFLGSSYQWTPAMGVYGGLEVVSNRAKFDNATYREVQYQYTGLKAGLTFQF